MSSSSSTQVVESFHLAVSNVASKEGSSFYVDIRARFHDEPAVSATKRLETLTEAVVFIDGCLSAWVEAGALGLGLELD
jgi:hypothetical protein